MNNKGFSLIEMLLYLGIFVILFALIISFVTWVYKINIRSTIKRELSSDIRNVMDIIGREIRQAESIYSPLTSLSQLSLKTNYYLPVDEPFSYIDFFVCGDQICFKKENQDPVSLISEKTTLKELSFKITDFNAVTIYLSLERKDPFGLFSPQPLSQATSTFSLRSYVK